MATKDSHLSKLKAQLASAPTDASEGDLGSFFGVGRRIGIGGGIVRRTAPIIGIRVRIIGIRVRIIGIRARIIGTAAPIIGVRKS